MLAILRNPLLYTEPLYGGKCGESKETSELETFCKAMGWTEVDGMLRKRPEVENKNGWRVEDLIDIENVHGDWAKANVKHEMKTSQTKGIEKLRSIEKLTDRKAAELRRVIFVSHLFPFNPQVMRIRQLKPFPVPLTVTVRLIHLRSFGDPLVES